MIFITLGTQSCDFSRCLKMVEEVMHKHLIKEPIIAQVGYTSYKLQGAECFKFVTEDEYQRYIQNANIIISHAGTGALSSAIRQGKKIIAVARLSKFNEMVNDHQTEIVKKLSREGYILDGTRSISEAWGKLDDFVPKKSDFECHIPQRIEEILNNWGIK